MLNQLRFGRGVDNRRLKAAGFEYGYTSREAVIALGEHLRLHPLMRGAGEPYRYEREVEEFLRWSPNVRRKERSQRQTSDVRRQTQSRASAARSPPPAPSEPAPAGPPVDHYDDLASEEIVSAAGLARAAGPRGAARVRARCTRGREAVLGAIESVLARASGSPLGA